MPEPTSQRPGQRTGAGTSLVDDRGRIILAGATDTGRVARRTIGERGRPLGPERVAPVTLSAAADPHCCGRLGADELAACKRRGLVCGPQRCARAALAVVT